MQNLLQRTFGNATTKSVREKLIIVIHDIKDQGENSVLIILKQIEITIGGEYDFRKKYYLVHETNFPAIMIVVCFQGQIVS